MSVCVCVCVLWIFLTIFSSPAYKQGPCVGDKLKYLGEFNTNKNMQFTRPYLHLELYAVVFSFQSQQLSVTRDFLQFRSVYDTLINLHDPCLKCV